METSKSLILFDHEIRRLLTGETLAIVRPRKEQTGFVRWNPIMLHGYAGWTDEHGYPVRCPLGNPGEVRFVREPHRIEQIKDGWRVVYKDGESRDILMGYVQWHNRAYALRKYKGGWRSSTLMPEWASRLSLEIMTSGAKQVQDVTDEEIEMMGISVKCGPLTSCPTCNRVDFGCLYDSHFPKQLYSGNPHVWIAMTRRV